MWVCLRRQTTLLLQLTTSLTLLAVATTLVDVLATRVLPARSDYKAVKYEVRVTTHPVVGAPSHLRHLPHQS